MRKKKKIDSSEDKEIQFGEDGIPITYQEEIEEPYRYPVERKTSKTKASFLSFLSGKGKNVKKTRGVPITFNVGLSILLFFIYLSVLLVSVPTAPYLLFIIVPTLYILIRHIKLEREQLGEKFG